MYKRQVSGGMPALSIVGLPDSAVRESGDRVHAAARNLGFKWPDRRITINLALLLPGGRSRENG